MLQTLTLVPIFWIWILWATVSLFGIVWLYRKHQWSSETLGFLPFVAISGLVVAFALPQVMAQQINPADPTGDMLFGLPIRGYGFFLLLATLTGVGLAYYRASKNGFVGDMILSLAFWMFICGIVGARLFFVIQKFDDFKVGGAQEVVMKMANMTEGGLVVYGSLIGALLAASVFFWLHRLPVFKIADIIAPCMVIGLSIGRIGCLMNGCCFGGVCDNENLGIQFPPESPPFFRHLSTGELLGAQGSYATNPALDTDEPTYFRVDSVLGDSVAEKAGVEPGNEILVRYYTDEMEQARYGRIDDATVTLVTKGGAEMAIPYSVLPKRSLPVYPTQIFSSINAFFLFGFLWFFFAYRRFDGQVIALTLIIYPIARFLLEEIRSDEFGLWGTSFTISQWVSFGTIFVGAGIYLYCQKNFPISRDEKSVELTAKES